MLCCVARNNRTNANKKLYAALNLLRTAQGLVVVVSGNCARNDGNGGDDIGDGSDGDDPAQLSLRPVLTLAMQMH